LASSIWLWIGAGSHIVLKMDFGFWIGVGRNIVSRISIFFIVMIEKLIF
jgi:hypothetical protein